MSRIGKQIIDIPAKTTVSVADDVLIVSGPGGTLEKRLMGTVEIIVEGATVSVGRVGSSIFSRSIWGTYASHVKNMITGVNTPYQKKLIIEGVGYRSEVAGTNLKLLMGFSHPVLMPIPGNLKVTVEKNEITITGADKEAVGQFAANVRAVRKPEPYKGKGIRYSTETVRRKQGKKAA
jgi:large subunit ribosomal protein L6